MTKAVCVFLASTFGRRLSYNHAARQLGIEIARRKHTLIYGGSRLGLMGVLADAALEHGANVIGVMNEAIYDKEAHPNLTKLHVVETLFERKQLMSALSDGFIAMPGGVGTLDELFEFWNIIKMGVKKTHLGLLNVDGFYDKLLKFMDYIAEENFLQQEHVDMIPVHHNPEILLDAMFNIEQKIEAEIS